MNVISKLRLVEIELFSYCNRKCSWCPNSYIDRKSDCQYLNWEVLDKLLIELKDNKFNGVFSFSRYNEPFSDYVTLYYAIQHIKEFFPNSKYVTNTNGDYITESVLKLVPIDELTIMDYDYKGRDYCLQKLQEWHVVDIKEYGHYFTGMYGNMKILYYYSWLEEAKISNRGGNLKSWSLQERDYPCYEPLFFIGINYDGTVSPCCNVRNDCQNRIYILGDLHEQSLSSMLKSEFYLDFVDAVTTGNFTEDMPCYYCNNNGGRYTRENGGILY